MMNFSMSRRTTTTTTTTTTCYALLSVLLVASLAFVVSSANVNRKVPTAFTVCGGGFYTMTNGMGIVRSWDESDILPETSHIGCTSGGCWFSLQFIYSKEFYESALGNDEKTVEEFVSTWGEKYSASVKIATEQQKFQNLTFTFESASKTCLLEKPNEQGIILADVITATVDAFLNKAQFPADNWFEYVEAMLSPYIADISNTLFSSKQEGFQTVLTSVSDCFCILKIVLISPIMISFS